jgi:23S rRNA (guanosine2251-2'-O)-methyltransferase
LHEYLSIIKKQVKALEQNRRKFYSQSLKKSGNSSEMIFGIRAIIETINAGKTIDKLLIQKELGNSELLKELLTLAREREVPVQKVPVEKLNRITTKNHQGAICFISAVDYALLSNILAETFEKGKTPLILILDRITDVRNFGAIARTAECSGVDAIVIPTKGAAQINADAVKTSAGALNFLPVCREEDLKKTIAYLQESGLQVVACTEKTDEWMYKADFTVPTAILLGSEEDGISPELLRKADQLAKIPLFGNIESLNVSVSAAVILYEAVRQRK